MEWKHLGTSISIRDLLCILSSFLYRMYIYIFVKCIIQSVFIINRHLIQRTTKLLKKNKRHYMYNFSGRSLMVTSMFSCYLIVWGFHRTFATGAVCQQRTLTPPDTWSSPTFGLAWVLMSRPISPELVLFPDFWVSNIPRYFYFAPSGLNSGLQGSVNVHRGALLLVPQWQCISSFVLYIFVTPVPFAVWSW